MTIYTLGLVYGANQQENYDKSHSNFKSTLEISTNFFSMCKDVWHVNISGINEVLCLAGARGISQD